MYLETIYPAANINIHLEQPLQRISLLLFTLSACLLIYLSGLLSLKYNIWPAEYITSSVNSIEDQFKQVRRKKIAQGLVKYNTDKAITATRALWTKAKAYEGYTLITARYSQHVYLLDMEGKIVHKWNAGFNKAWPKPKHLKTSLPNKRIYLEKAVLYPNGDILVTYTGAGDTPYGYGLAKFNKNSQLLWKYSQHTHHDIYIDQTSGDIYALIHSFVRSPIEGLEGLQYPILAEHIVRLSPDGKELDRIFIPTTFRDSSYKEMLYKQQKSQLPWDRFHTNAIMKLEPSLAKKFPLFKAGDLLISLRNLNAIAVIDPHTKQVRWAYDGLWKSQHSAKFTSRGTIMLFDNKARIYNKNPYSRIIEINPNTLQIEWSYIGTPDNNFFSDIYGRVQELI